eukprot:Pompholyxophrys_sp_v1_NODE_20_length_4050_cov_7.809011.p3 type:complete len:103 gc:universal NODE_20_length_4050_cov_7.809011:950-1258(+)
MISIINNIFFTLSPETTKSGMSGVKPSSSADARNLFLFLFTDHLDVILERKKPRPINLSGNKVNIKEKNLYNVSSPLLIANLLFCPIASLTSNNGTIIDENA